MRTRVIIHKLKDHLISTIFLDREGQLCPTCDINQPFNNWLCRICGSNSYAGDWADDTLDNFDQEFESLQEPTLKLVCKTKRGNYLFSRIKN